MSASLTPTSRPDGYIATLLVVDDEVLIRMTLAEYLRDHGYRVLEAVDVAEAKALLSADAAVDLVFSDIQMPGGENGYALAEWVRGERPHTRILLTTGFATAPAGRRPEGIATVPKPYELDAVRQRIEGLLGLSSNPGAGIPG
jgi:CheY-like chemotaxis protein